MFPNWKLQRQIKNTRKAMSGVTVTSENRTDLEKTVELLSDLEKELNIQDFNNYGLIGNLATFFLIFLDLLIFNAIWLRTIAFALGFMANYSLEHYYKLQNIKRYVIFHKISKYFYLIMFIFNVGLWLLLYL